MKRMPRVKAERAAERANYGKQKAEYLVAHPLDQIKIAMCGFSETAVLTRAGGLTRSNAQGIFYQGQLIQFANQIHHRNKADHARLCDQRWWMSTVLESHDLVENRKNWARDEGYLLPIQADIDGRWGAGNQALETPAFMESKVR